jgi:hypothetical protein
MKVKLAEAVLRRKELQGHVDRLREINVQGLFEVRVTRKPAHEGIDDITARIPKISMNQATHAYNWHAKQLRSIDAAIQQANWTVEVQVPDDSMGEYIDPYVANKRDD